MPVIQVWGMDMPAGNNAVGTHVEYWQYGNLVLSPDTLILINMKKVAWRRWIPAAVAAAVEQR
jgi:hypothetical protein